MIYHVATSEDWNMHLTNSTYEPEAYAKERFIHCSTKEQVQGVVQRYYAGQKNLILLHIDETKLTVEWKYEEASNKELFPHVFGPINKEAIVTVENL